MAVGLKMKRDVSAQRATGSTASASPAARYRPEVDGLRAIAVLSVVVYHVSSATLWGGYLGVDVFFVISGFLITQILIREAEGGVFSITRFYERRIRRIGPALVVVLIVTTALSMLVMLPADLVGMAKSLFATLSFSSNIYFWRDSDYFSPLAEQKPLLHTWSLAVEEQFYILFPFLVAALVRRARSWTLPVLIAIAAVSFIGNLYALKIGARIPAFYLLPTRAWELGAGAIVAVVVRRPSSPIVNDLICVAGLAAMAFSLSYGPMLLPASVPDATLAVGGAAAVIFSGEGARRGAWVLRQSPAIFAGLISYSLYLWHWPLIVLARYYVVEPLGAGELGALILLMFVLATASWRWIERPFRSGSMPVSRVLAVTGAGVATSAVLGIVILASGGLPSRLDAAAARVNASVGTHYRCPVQDYLAAGGSRSCRLNLPSGSPADADVVLLGNSHAQMYAPLVRSLIAEHGLKGLLVPANYCQPMTGTNVLASCADIMGQNMDLVLSLSRVKTVVIATDWNIDSPYYDAAGQPATLQGAAALQSGLDETINRLVSAGKRVILVGPIDTPGYDVASVVSRDLAFKHPISRPLGGSVEAFRTKYGTLVEHYANDPRITFVRPDLVQCHDAQCAYIRDGESLFSDFSHIAEGALPLFRDVFEKGLRSTFQ